MTTTSLIGSRLSPPRKQRVVERLYDRVILEIERCDPDIGLSAAERDFVHTEVDRCTSGGQAFTSADMRRTVTAVLRKRGEEMNSAISAVRSECNSRQCGSNSRGSVIRSDATQSEARRSVGSR